METTRATLIERVRDAADAEAWTEFYELYSGLIYRYARERGLNDTDAMDTVGDCLEALSRRMRDFDYDPQRCRFRNYLRVIVTNKVIALLRKKKVRKAEPVDFGGLEDPADAPDEVWDQQWRISHLMHCWSQIEKDVSPLYAEAFRRCAIDGQPIAEVAEHLNISANHVSQIKVRMTRRLRLAMLDLIDEQD